MLSVPPVTLTSARVKSSVGSLKVKVTVPVWPWASSDWVVLSATVGGAVSMTTGSMVLGLDRPAGLVSTTLRLLVPSGRGVVGVRLQEPLGPTTAVPITLPEGSVIWMVLPGVPVPLMTGLFWLVIRSVAEPLLLPGSMAAVGAKGATGAGV